MNINDLKIAIVGATGAVGREILNILEERDFPINNIYLLASSNSKGQKISFLTLVCDANYKNQSFLHYSSLF